MPTHAPSLVNTSITPPAEMVPALTLMSHMLKRVWLAADGIVGEGEGVQVCVADAIGVREGVSVLEAEAFPPLLAEAVGVSELEGVGVLELVGVRVPEVD